MAKDRLPNQDLVTLATGGPTQTYRAHKTPTSLPTAQCPHKQCNREQRNPAFLAQLVSFFEASRRDTKLTARMREALSSTFLTVLRDHPPATGDPTQGGVACKNTARPAIYLV